MRRSFRLRALFLVVLTAAFVATACIPAKVSRIGPPRARKPKDCEIRVLPPGETPDRPWVDIGVVLLENCQDYHEGMCKKWVMQKACELGGEIAYLPNPESPKDAVNNVLFRVVVAVYAVSLTTPFPGEQGCKEPHSDPQLVTNADTETAAPANADTEPDAASKPAEKCTE